MERDTASRFRRAVQDNNLFLIKRLARKVGDLRNPDPGPSRYSSLAWAAVSGSEEVFEYLLDAGHDDVEISKDAENNTILILLAGLKPNINDPNRSRTYDAELQARSLRMAHLYWVKYSFTIDYSNNSGKTAVHTAAVKGNEEFVRMLIDIGCDIDLPDLQGNTPLHYASAWGHISVLQTLIERGCRFATRNNEGFDAADYAYSTATNEVLQDCARLQYENNKRERRNKRQAELAARAELHGRDGQRASGRNPQHSSDATVTPAEVSRFRSGSNATSTTESTDAETSLPARKRAVFSSAVKSQISLHSSNLQASRPSPPTTSRSETTTSDRAFFSTSKSSQATTPSFELTSDVSQASISSSEPHINETPSALTPIATRMREKDADAIAQFMDVLKRARSGSQGGNGSSTSASAASPPVKGSNISGARAAIHKLRQSVSAAQLRISPEANVSADSQVQLASIGDEHTPLASSALSITPRASETTLKPDSNSTVATPHRRSPFAILSRATSQGTTEVGHTHRRLHSANRDKG